MSSLTIENVTKTYDENLKAVNDANLRIDDGEFAVLVGPSGCGKSTLLRMIAGLEEITEGTISIGNQVVNNIPPKDRNIAMVFQNYALYPHMTVFENMAFGLKLRKYPKDEIRKRVHEAVELLDLTDYLNRKPKVLSGGQRQRVAVGRAIVRKPDVFLFDEPLSNLDAKLRVQMRIQLTKLHSKLGATVVYVTHDQVEAMTMGDRIVVMNKGVIQQVDMPLNVYNAPANLFVAGFIGSPSMNFFTGKIEENKNLKFVSDEFELVLPDSVREKIESYKHNEIKLGIRPEHFRVFPKQSKRIGINGRIEVIELMGNEAYVYVQSKNGQIVARINEFKGFEPDMDIILEPEYNLM
ncbi:MAG TPA: sn-glycerol-3-phosphate ABC transporter ATP-binding protein UgpC, partial [Caldithrix sp.]|nr:sn-glycerol-3-phosphate ABC transporter ATP-binding protein UgpC [Caldithrix sp.]